MKLMNPRGHRSTHDYVLLRNIGLDVNQRSTVHRIKTLHQKFVFLSLHQTDDMKPKPVWSHLRARREYTDDGKILSVPWVPLQQHPSGEVQPSDHEKV